MAFIDARLPDRIEMNARGGPAYSTTVLKMQSGREKRNINWPVSLGTWDVAYGARKLSDIREIVDCFDVMYGMGHTFRFRDWMNYKLLRQTIGTTDGTDATWQLYRRRSFGGQNRDQPIYLPVSGTVRCWVDNVERTMGSGSSEFQVSLTTGVITLGATLAALSAKTIEAACQFDRHVRFNTDNLRWAIELMEIAGDEEEDDGVAGIPEVPIVEVPV